MRIGSDAWFRLRLVLGGPQSTTRGYSRVQFRIDQVDPATTDLLMIGKVEPHY